MKIGILTYFGDLNTGTNLQAYATLKAIEQFYPSAEVQVINYHAWKSRNIPYLRGGISLKSLKNDLRRIKGFNRFKNKYITKTKRALYSSNYNKAIDFIKSFNFEAIFVGADTLLELHRINDGLTAYWLSPTLKCKKYFIAASARDVTFESLTNLQKKLIRDSLADFSQLGVRDMATYKLLLNFNKEKLKLIPDPTFTLNIDYSPIEQYLKKRKIDISRPIVCLHLKRTDYWGKELAAKLKRRGFQIASFRPNSYSDILLNDLYPMEQLGIYRYFKLMITHRFHDTIFCLKNDTPMITYPFDDSYTIKNGESKYFSLLNEFGLIDTNYIKRKSSITANSLMERIDIAISGFHEKRSIIEHRLVKNRKNYHDFLKDTLFN